MKVLKFGGSSVASAATIRRIRDIVTQQEGNCLVVVSALGGITDLILEAAQLASTGKEYLPLLNKIKKRHLDTTEELFNSSSVVGHIITRLLKELEQILTGITLVGELTPKTLDRIAGLGERISSHIVAHFLPEAVRVDASELICTDSTFGKAQVDYKITYKQIVDAFNSFKGVAVIPGFIAKNSEGEYTTLGRGGSDYTAALFAAALNVEALEIWTDVNGYMTADPKVISKAYTITDLTYAEAMELSHFGGKVIYPPTILPVYKTGTPILIKNTFNPDAPGTRICNSTEAILERPIKGISSISGIALLTLQGIGMVGVTGISMRLFTALARINVNVILISQASSENSISVAVNETSVEQARDAINQMFEKEINRGKVSRVAVENDLSVVAIVGEHMKHTTGIAGKLFSTIGKNGINIIAIAQGASELNISWVVKTDELRKTLNVVHESFFLSEYAELNVFLTGIGTVGSSLLSQIKKQQKQLLDEQHLRIRLTGLANSKKMIFSRDGIDIDNYKDELTKSTTPSSMRAFTAEMKTMNIFNSVFIDCTASKDVADHYLEILDANISIVTANKIAASSSYKKYTDLKNRAKQKGVKFLFETNVGAGLPIINTLNDLVYSGDRILKIEAVLSGTLNFIFNTLSEEIPLSRAIMMAKEQGYSEPDPRIDLSGIDVARKILILARESGFPLEMEDITIEKFIPDDLFDGPLQNFWDQISTLDAPFEEQRKKLYASNKKWRFVASYANGKAKAGLQEIEEHHPFYDLEGSNNLVMYTTERYNEYPMLIKGYGAGASVTAAGVFADLIKVANI